MVILFSLFPAPELHAAPWVGTACADTISEHSTDPSLPHGSGEFVKKRSAHRESLLIGEARLETLATAEAGLTF